MARGGFGLVGAGAVGPVVARRLVESGWSLRTVASRRMASALAAVEFVGSGRASTANPDAAAEVNLLVIAVPDRAVLDVAGEIARSGRVETGCLALHLSGALTSEALAPLRAAGASAGSVHPLQSFADASSALARMPGSFLFYEGDDPERIRAVAADLSARTVRIRAEDKVLYHAGAAAACNLAVAMVDLGVRLFGEAGIERSQALDALLPLVAGTVANLEAVGLPRALTGPVARGDVDTIRRHATAIRDRCPDLWPAYMEATRHAVRIGIEKGTLGEEAARRIREITG